MSRKSMRIVFSTLMILTFVLSACQPPTPETIVQTVVVEKEGTPIVVTQVVEKTVEVQVEVAAPTEVPAPGKKILYLTGGASDNPTIDPSHSTQVTSVQVAGENAVGLFRQNEVTADVEKGMATSYEASEDGLVYTIKIMDNVPWVKYDPTKDEVVKVQDCEGKDRMVTAEDFKYGLMRSLNPATASEYPEREWTLPLLLSTRYSCSTSVCGRWRRTEAGTRQCASYGLLSQDERRDAIYHHYPLRLHGSCTTGLTSQGVVGEGSRAERLSQGLAAAARWLGKPKSLLLAECYISAVPMSRTGGKARVYQQLRG